MAKTSYMYLVCVLLLCTLAPAYAQVYTVTDLGVLSTSSPASFGCGVSPSGNYATGYSFDSNYKYRMWQWTSATGMQAISTTRVAKGFAVNDSGRIAGQSYENAVSYDWFAAYYNGTSLVTVGSAYQQMYWLKGCGYGINSANMMCGVGIWGWWVNSPKTQALVCNTNATGVNWYSLGVLSTAPATGTSMGYGINENGKIVGASNYSTLINKYHAFLWTPTSANATTGSMTDIHTLANFEQSYAKAINDNDDIVGFCQNAFGEANKNAWRKLATGQMELLPTLAAPFYYQGTGYTASEANGINNSGVIVGSAGYLNDRSSGVCFAVRWVDGQLQDLNHCIDLRSAIRLDEANGIGTSGHIVGTGRVNNETHAFLLTPITNPTVSPTPSIVSISPTTVRAPQLPAVLHLTGQGFTEQSVVFCKTSSYVIPQRLTTRYISSTELEADLTYSNSLSIFVINPYPGGGESNWVEYVPIPNQGPIALSDDATTQADVALDINLLINDTDPEGDAISIGALSSSSNYSDYNNERTLQGGWVSISNIEGLDLATYTPPAGFIGLDTFMYQAKDQYGSYSASALVTVNVVTGNTPPVAVDDSATVVRNTVADIDVLKNDSDPDADTISILSVDTPDRGGNAYIVSIDGKEKIHYEPSWDFTGTEMFTYTISDSHGATASATVIISVDESAPPVAEDDNVSIQANAEVDLDVLANDFDPNPGNTQLLITDIGAPSNGGMVWVVSIDGRDHIHYVPATDFAGTETFTYTVIDDLGLMDSAAVTVNVGGIFTIVDSFTDPRLAAAGDNVQVWAQVAQGDYPITSVTVDGVDLTKQPDDNWWSGAYAVSSDLGWHWLQIVATDSVGNTATGWEWYRTVPVVYANSKALREPIMSNADDNFLFCISGAVSVVDDYRFWLDDGGTPVYVYCTEQHHLDQYSGQVRARGRWYYNDDYLYVTAATAVTKLQ